MSEKAFRDMIIKFHRTGQLGVLPDGKGRKRANNAVVKKIATAMVEASKESLHRTVNILAFLHNLDMLYSPLSGIT